MTARIKASRALRDVDLPQSFDTDTICLICATIILPDDLNEETEESQGSKRILNIIAKLLQMSETIYLKTDVDCVSTTPLLCSPCFETVTSAMNLKEAMTTLQNQLRRLTNVIKSDLIRSYCKDGGNQERSSNVRYEEIKRIRKTYAQCLIGCEVRLGRTAETEEMSQSFVLEEKYNLRGSNFEQPIPAGDFEWKRNVITPFCDFDDPGDECWEQEDILENQISDSESNSLTSDPFESVAYNKTCHRCGKIFTRASSLKKHLQKKFPCSRVDFKSRLPTQVLTLPNSVSENNDTQIDGSYFKVEIIEPTVVNDNIQQTFNDSGHSGSQLGLEDIKIDVPTTNISNITTPIEDTEFQDIGCSSIASAGEPDGATQNPLNPLEKGSDSDNLPISFMARKRMITAEAMKEGKARVNKVSLGFSSRVFNSGRFQCQYCSQIYARNNLLKRHIAWIHNGSSSSRPYYCNLCSISFRDDRSLQSHIRRKHKPKQECHLCKESVDEDIFEFHLEMHNCSTDFPCPVCPMRLTTTRALVFHNSTVHTLRNLSEVRNNKERFMCKICFKNFPSFSSLYTHRTQSHSKIKT